jgi:two-component system, NtrC family, sensor kinase
MRYTGITAEILINILFITAVAMFLIGIIAFKVTERVALQGKVQSVKSLTGAIERSYFRENDIEGGVEFLREALPEGAWAVVSANDGTVISGTSTADRIAGKSDTLIAQALTSGEIAIDIEGMNIPPISSYKGFKAAIPVKLAGGEKGAILISQPLSVFDDNIILNQRLIALWIILFLIVIAFFGFYILSRRVIKPVRELIYITEKIADGKFPDNIDIGKVREINQLYSALRVMYGEIEEGKKKLRDKINELEQKNTELKQTQGELIASEKLASLGRLSAGVAHEIGNPLSAISGYVEVLKRRPSDPAGTKYQYLGDIEREVQRLDKIIKTLLEYSRPKKYEHRILDINSVIRDSIDIIQRQGILHNISLNEELCEDSLQIEADPHQLSQVIINLILNAKDATADRGEIKISSGVDSDEDVYIRVGDNGAGIPSGLLDQIFDPFFTTKEPGKGTGLGLSVSQRIVEAFGGTMTVRSEEGKGTLFTLTLPRLRDYDKAENFSS